MNLYLTVLMEVGIGGCVGKWRNQSKDNRRERLHIYSRTLLSGPKYIIFTYSFILFGYRLAKKTPIS